MIQVPIIISREAPSQKNVIWAKPDVDAYNLFINTGGGWKSAGRGDSVTLKQLTQILDNRINVDDVKVNDVSVLDSETKEASINITASVVENDTPGNPTANATMQDGNINIEFEHVKGERGNGIASVTEELSDQDGGINTTTITDDDGQTHTIHTRNGRQGRPGADFQPIEDVSGLSIAHNLGTDETKVMSQKGVTDAFKEYGETREDNTDADFSIADEVGRDIIQIDGGHVRTKNFDSANIGQQNLSNELLAEIRGGGQSSQISLNGIYSRENPFGTSSEIIYKDAAMRMLPDNVIPLIIIAGQSNADGRAPYASAENWPETQWLAENGYSVDDYFMWNDRNQDFLGYNVRTNNGAGTDNGDDGSGADNYSFDPFFAKAFIEEYGTPLYALRVAVGGIGVGEASRRGTKYYTWNAKIGCFDNESYDVNYLLLTVIDRIKSIKTWCAVNGKILLPIAILWHQGEHDAAPSLRQDYKENLEQVISFFRGIFQAPALPFINGYINATYSENYAAVNDIYDEMNEIDDYMKTVDMSGHYTSSSKGDNIHYDGEAFAYMGEEMFKYYKELNT